jgi:hypothetical protein
MVKDSFGRKGIPQSQRHVPRYEARLALGIQQDAEADSRHGGVSAVSLPLLVCQQNQRA